MNFRYVALTRTNLANKQQRIVHQRMFITEKIRNNTLYTFLQFGCFLLTLYFQNLS